MKAMGEWASGRVGEWVQLIVTAIALLSFPAAGIGQTITGKVTEQAGGAPLRGAFVMLLDASGRRVQGILTNATGDFTLRAQPGRYSLRADLIGHRTAAVPVFELAEGQTKSVALAQIGRAHV